MSSFPSDDDWRFVDDTRPDELDWLFGTAEKHVADLSLCVPLFDCLAKAQVWYASPNHAKSFTSFGRNKMFNHPSKKLVRQAFVGFLDRCGTIDGTCPEHAFR